MAQSALPAGLVAMGARSSQQELTVMLATPRETPNEFLQDFILGCLFLTIAIVAALKYRRVANLQEAEVSDQHETKCPLSKHPRHTTKDMYLLLYERMHAALGLL